MTHLELLLSRYPALAPCREDIQRAFALLQDAYAGGGKLLACGNGGSASDAAHIVGELMKSFARPRDIGSARQRLCDALPEADAAYLAAGLEGALPAVSLHGEVALVSAFANDAAPDLIYAQQVLGLGRPGDSLLALSTSGNSKNVVRAVQTAKALGLGTVGLTGRGGGALAKWCDVCVRVPETETYRVQELHLPVYHALCRMLEDHFFGGGAA